MVIANIPYSTILYMLEKYLICDFTVGLFEIIRGLRQLYLIEKIQIMAKQMRSGLERADATKCQCYAQCKNFKRAKFHIISIPTYYKSIYASYNSYCYHVLFFNLLTVLNLQVSMQ